MVMVLVCARIAWRKDATISALIESRSCFSGRRSRLRSMKLSFSIPKTLVSSLSTVIWQLCITDFTLNQRDSFSTACTCATVWFFVQVFSTDLSTCPWD